jgi:hypothetical protein
VAAFFGIGDLIGMLLISSGLVTYLGCGGFLRDW